MSAYQKSARAGDGAKGGANRINDSLSERQTAQELDSEVVIRVLAFRHPANFRDIRSHSEAVAGLISAMKIIVAAERGELKDQEQLSVENRECNSDFGSAIGELR